MKLTTPLTQARKFQTPNRMRRLFTFCIIFICFSIIPSSTFGVHKTYMWPTSADEDHIGYTIELIPGTGVNGIPAEYVAAGTIGPGLFAPVKYKWHFMHLDANGTILHERITEALSEEIELRVVDIAAESNSRFWITIQVRDKRTSNLKDYIHIAGVNTMGNNLIPNSTIEIKSDITQSSHENIYPTNSYFSSGSLYICGYACSLTQYPNAPDKISGDKIGFVFKTDVNISPAVTNSYTWSTGGNSTVDFDMPLKIIPYSSTDDFPLLITGAANTDIPEISGVLAGKIDQSGLGYSFGVISGFHTANGPDDYKGDYGIDIRTIDDRQNPDPDYVILTNYFEDLNPNDRTWGVIRTQENFLVYPSGNNSFLKLADSKSWAKQFNEIELTNDGSGQNVTIVGEQIDIYDLNCLNYGSNKAPSTFNVNPFFANIPINDNSNVVWNSTTGFNVSSISSMWTANTVHFSHHGTGAGSMEYYQESNPSPNALYDVTRLYTFCSRRDLYFENMDPNNPIPNQEPALITGYGNVDYDPINSVKVYHDLILRQKFIKTNSSYEEPDCQEYDQDCTDLLATEAQNPPFAGISNSYNLLTSNTTFTMSTVYNQQPAEFDCSSGYYKPTSISSHYSNTDVQIYPNPTSDLIQVDFSAKLNGRYTFSLTDIMGKQVHSYNGQMKSKNSIMLPKLPSGVYIATITYGNKSQIQKIFIK